MENIQFEEPINFFEELHNSSNNGPLEPSSNNGHSVNDDLCLISFMPLESDYVELKCGHKFNYKPLFNEIYNQKYVLHKYSNIYSHTKDKYYKFLQKHWFYIKCPYCRELQTECLPYKPDIINSMVYGINSDDLKLNKDPYMFSVLHPLNNQVSYTTQCAFCGDKELYKKYFHKGKFEEICDNGPFLYNHFTCKTYCEGHQIAMLGALEKLRKKGLGFIPKFCTAILKTGKNKGSCCGLDAIQNEFCNRHQPK
jgi:hypothetical protein